MDKPLNLAEIYREIKTFPNGETVAKKMAELWTFVLEPDNEDFTFAIEKLETAIVAQEEEFLQRKSLDIFKTGSLLARFQTQLKRSSNEEWESFKAENNISPIKKEGIQPFLSDANSQVKLPQFKQWVLGEDKQTRDITTETNIWVQIANKSEKKE